MYELALAGKKEEAVKKLHAIRVEDWDAGERPSAAQKEPVTFQFTTGANTPGKLLTMRSPGHTIMVNTDMCEVIFPNLPGFKLIVPTPITMEAIHGALLKMLNETARAIITRQDQ